MRLFLETVLNHLCNSELGLISLLPYEKFNKPFEHWKNEHLRLNIGHLVQLRKKNGLEKDDLQLVYVKKELGFVVNWLFTLHTTKKNIHLAKVITC